MSNTRRKLAEAHYFLKGTEFLLRRQSYDFEFCLNAFVNAARNVTFVMQKEYRDKKGFKEWWEVHTLCTDKSAKRFVLLRNVSVKERSVGHKKMLVKHDFGPKGLKVEGMKGPTSVVSDPIRFDQPIPDHSYVSVKDDHGERRVRVSVIHDFSVIETYEDGSKEIKFDNFLTEAKEYVRQLEEVVKECEANFSLRGSLY